MASTTDEHPQTRSDLEVNEVEDGLVVYDTARDRVHYLDATASIVFALCTGANDEATMVEQLAAAFGQPADEVARHVSTALALFRTEGLLA
ncbi:MAG: PqqD family peptide modification chaperone [Actinomycetota bacterium]